MDGQFLLANQQYQNTEEKTKYRRQPVAACFVLSLSITIFLKDRTLLNHWIYFSICFLGGEHGWVSWIALCFHSPCVPEKNVSCKLHQHSDGLDPNLVTYQTVLKQWKNTRHWTTEPVTWPHTRFIHCCTTERKRGTAPFMVAITVKICKNKTKSTT